MVKSVMISKDREIKELRSSLELCQKQLEEMTDFVTK